jgi:hypothetical protein
MMFTAPILSRAPDLDRLRFLALIPARAPHREEAASAPKAHGSADAGVPATVATDTAAAVAVGARTEAGVAIVIRPWSEISTSQVHLLRVHPQFGPFLTRSDSKSANEHWSCSEISKKTTAERLSDLWHGKGERLWKRRGKIK